MSAQQKQTDTLSCTNSKHDLFVAFDADISALYGKKIPQVIMADLWKIADSQPKEAIPDVFQALKRQHTYRMPNLETLEKLFSDAGSRYRERTWDGQKAQLYSTQSDVDTHGIPHFQKALRLRGSPIATHEEVLEALRQGYRETKSTELLEAGKELKALWLSMGRDLNRGVREDAVRLQNAACEQYRKYGIAAIHMSDEVPL